MNTFSLIHADVLEGLRSLPDQSVNCCVTSPPYWGLRAYGTASQVWGGLADCEHAWEDTSYRDSRKLDTTAGPKQRTNVGATGWRDALRQNQTCAECGAWSGELGLEPTPQLFIEHLVLIFRELRRVLRNDGNCWLNLGDSYATGGGAVGRCPGDGEHGERFLRRGMISTQPNRMPIPGLKPKDLVGIPWRAAFALQADGWWLRSDIIWAKPAPMPESVKDRPTRSHEYIFLLTKAERYFYDHEAIKEPAVSDHGSGNGYKRDSRLTYSDADGARGSDKPWKPKGRGGKNAFRGQGHFRETATGPANREGREMRDVGAGDTRNKRDVWTVNTQPFRGAHFAVFPPVLIEPCILAGCPADGIVLDPFCGSGTTGEVSLRHGRHFIGIDLNADYIDMSRKRLERVAPMFCGDQVTPDELIERAASQDALIGRLPHESPAPERKGFE